MGTAPYGELVSRGRLGSDRSRAGAGQQRAISRFDRDVGAAADKPRTSGKCRNPRSLVAAAGVDVVTAGLQQPDAATGNIDLDGFALAELGDVEIDSPVRDGDFRHSIVQIGDRDLGALGEGDRVGTDSDQGAGLRVGAQRYAAGNRVVDFGIGPDRFARAAKADLSRNQADPADPAGQRCRCCGGGREPFVHADVVSRCGDDRNEHRSESDANKEFAWLPQYPSRSGQV